MRADAKRHRETLVLAATRVFTRQGGDAPLQAVLDEAQLGRGTLYRHFPDREALLVAVFEHVHVELSGLFAEHRHSPELLRHFLCASAKLKPPLARMPTNVDTDRIIALTEPVRRKFVTLQQEIVDAAILSGVVRPDFDAANMALAVSMIIGAGQTANWDYDKAIDTAIDIIIRGFSKD